MKRCAVVAILALAMSYPVVAAEKQSEQSVGSQRPYAPSLAVVMELIQLSHFKLWLAGSLRNWPLAEYVVANEGNLAGCEKPVSECPPSRH